MKNKGFIMNDENRLHISLSTSTLRTIESDMANFGYDITMKNKSGYLNMIFRNYFEDFPLAPKYVLKNTVLVREMFVGNKIDSATVEQITEKLTNSLYHSSINGHAKMYGDDEKLKVKLNRENTELLKHIEYADFFDLYAPRSGLGFYLKAIFESYARLPKLARERIYIQDKINIIESCIAKAKKIRIGSKEGQKIVKPLMINNQNRKQTNQLIYSYETESGLTVDEIDIRRVDLTETNESSVFTGMAKLIEDKYKDQIQKDMVVHANQESYFHRRTYKVKFTPKGLQRLRYEEDNLPIKGIVQDGDESTLMFQATDSEVFYYLFRFGAQAEVMEPVDFREKMKEMYYAAYDVYSKGSDVNDNPSL